MQLLSMLLLLSFSCPEGAECKKVKHGRSTGLILKQKSRILGPGITVFLTAKAVRWRNASSGISVVSRAPAWDVTVYNTKKKRFYRCKLSRFSNPTVSSVPTLMIGFNPGAIRFSKFSQERILGQTVRHYFYKASGRDSIPYSAHCWCISEAPANDKNIELLNRIYFGRRNIEGVPVRFVAQRTNRSKNRPSLTTTSIERVNLPHSTFKLPLGYETSESLIDVWSSSQMTDAIDNMLRIKDRQPE